tara:strand:+ start:713 stop:952 length:240 start_codon:yes stop_codon:yes gene_type:complete
MKHEKQYAERATVLTVKFYAKKVYGSTLLYPANEQAEKFCELTGTKTLQEWQLKRIFELGFNLEQVSDPEDAIKIFNVA